MRKADLLRLALAALWRHKVRTVLTLSGVIAGTFLLVVSISIGRGVEEASVNQLRKSDQLRKITVFPSYTPVEGAIKPEELIVHGDMNEERRKRIRQSLIRHWPRRHLGAAPTRPLDERHLEALNRLDHVESVTPALQFACQVRLKPPADQERKWDDVLVSAPVSDGTDGDRLGQRVVEGDPLPAAGKQVLIHEYLLYVWKKTRDEDVADLIGQKIEVRYVSRVPIMNPMLSLVAGSGMGLTEQERDLLDQALVQLGKNLDLLRLTEDQQMILKKVLPNMVMGPGTEREVFHETFTIAGVLREWDEKDKSSTFFVRDWVLRDAELFMPAATAKELFSQDPRHVRFGYPQVIVTVKDEEHLKEVTEKITKMGFRVYSLAEVFASIKKNILVVSIASAFLAAMALLVASIGITNMMLMSVMERTREIGLMKAVGAGNRHILTLFLAEGALLGAVGGGVGLLLGWLASFPGDAIARSLVESELETRLEHSVFVFPLWLLLGAPLFAFAVATLSAVYPARRAAGIEPIQALRHE